MLQEALTRHSAILVVSVLSAILVVSVLGEALGSYEVDSESLNTGHRHTYLT